MLRLFEIIRWVVIALVAIITVIAWVSLFTRPASATPALSCEITSAHAILFTDHTGAEAGQFDEGAGLRGGGITTDCNGYEITVSGFKNSLHNGGMGYSVSLTHDSMAVMLGDVELRPLAQINNYPDQRDNPATHDGWFATFGISASYQITDSVGVFVNAYPTLGRDVSFDNLIVAGVTWGF